MKRTVYTWMLTLLTVFGATVASADEKVSFEVKAPMVVAKGEAVRVEFSLNASPDEGSFTAPSFEGFDVIAGPAFSQGSSIQIVNGQMTRSSNYTITYVLLPQQEGNFTIGAASVRVGKSQYKTKALPIEVVEETPESSGGQQAVQGGQSADDVQQVSKDDILLRMILSRTTAFKGEPIRATLKLYYRVNLRGDNGSKFPSFNGFWAQEIEQDAQPQRERYNGKVYETQVIKEYLLYPQQSGELTVEPAELNVVAQVLVQSANPDPFFGGGHEVYDVRRSLRTAPVKVTVRDLPAGAPASFSGAVGKFTMASDVPSTELAANSAATYTIKISGTGNLSFVQAPKLTLPSSFEQYNVKTTESMKTTAAGTTGYRQFEYPFIARAEGEYEIAPVEFTYFDPAKKPVYHAFDGASADQRRARCGRRRSGAGGHGSFEGGCEAAGAGHPFHQTRTRKPAFAGAAVHGRDALFRAAGGDRGTLRGGIRRAAQTDPRPSECGAHARQASQQGGRTAVPCCGEIHAGGEPPCLLRGDAAGVVGLHERQVQHSGGQSDKGERARGAQ